MTPGAVRRDPLLRLLRLARPWRGRLLLAVVAGAAAAACGIALLAVSGFLLARASQHPSILAISAAVVAVRALSAGRGLSRYLERLAGHDAAFRILADVRVSFYRRLERLAPAGLAAFSSGDLLARLISDVDATQDLFIRGITPPLAAALAGAGSVVACLLILAPAGVLLAVGLLAAGVGIPVFAAVAARGAARRLAPARGQLAATFSDLLAGAAELHAYGAQDAALVPVTAADRDMTRQADRNAAVSGLSAGLSSAIAGLALWGVLLLGVAATGDGALTRVPLAVLTLTALASFEVVTALPAAAVQLGQARVSGRRIAAVLDAPNPVREPAAPRPLPPGPVWVTLRGAQVRYRPGDRLALDGIDLDLPPGRRVGLVGPNGAGKSTVASVLLRFVELTAGTATLNGHDLASYSADDVPDQDRRLPAGPAHLRHVPPGESPPGQAGRLRRSARRRGRAGRAAGLDRVAAARLGYSGPRSRGSTFRRPAPAAGPGPRPARRPRGADTRRARRTPASRGPPRADRRPPRRDRRTRDAFHHPRPRRARAARRDSRAGGRKSR